MKNIKTDEDEKFRQDAKQMVDTLFDKDLFKERIKRDDMKALEDWINMTLTHRYSSEKRITELMDKINPTKL